MPLTLHIVPHTHWDREWYLPFQAFRMRLVHLMDRLLAILSNQKAYRHFMLDGQSILLEDYLEIRPERAQEIAHLVRIGRLTIGPWYVLPDEFLVAPESLVRNLMLGDKLCSRFGEKMRVGYVPDPFGHISQLPQIMRGFGIETVAFRRGLAEEPAELWWDAPDHSRVLACYLRDGYDNAAHLPTLDPDAFVAAVRSTRDSLALHTTSGQVLLMAGTDHQEPQPELTDLIAYANDGRLDGDRLVHSSLPTYVAAVREAMQLRQVVEGELRSPQRHHLLPGVLSTRMWIKQRNDAIETLLIRWAEPFAAWAELVAAAADTPDIDVPAHLTGHEPLRRIGQPGPLIWHAWRLLLQNHPHDSICGCSVDQVHREMRFRFDQAEQIAKEVIIQSLRAVAEQVDTQMDTPRGQPTASLSVTSQPVVVFNPTRGPRTDIVTARLSLLGASDTVQVIGSDGQPLLHQISAEPVPVERSFFDVEMTPEELAANRALIQDGRLLNHVIQRVELSQSKDSAELLLILGENGEPDRARLEIALARIEDLIAAGRISRFIVRGVIAPMQEISFLASNLPGYGYATFVVRSRHDIQGGARQMPSGTLSLSTAGLLENDLFRIQVDSSTGSFTLTDKITGVVYPGLNRFVDGGDRGDEYNYCQPEQDQVIAEPAEPARTVLIESGPARQTLEISQVYRVPRTLRQDRRSRIDETHQGLSPTVDLIIVSQLCLYPGVRRVDIRTTVENNAQDHRLRVQFPVPVAVDDAYTEAHYHVARRPVPRVSHPPETHDWSEQPVPTVPQRGWAEVSNGQIGLLVANRGLPEVEFVPENGQTQIALTLLRCVGWLSRDDMHCRRGHAGPEMSTPEAQCPGRHTFHYALIPFAAVNGEFHQHQLSARVQAEAFRAPLRAVSAGVHTGSLPPATSIVRVEPSTFALTAIKQPEERSSTPGLLVRGVNMSDQPLDVRLRPWRAFDRIVRVNLNEDFVEPLLAAADGSVTIPARPWEIITTRWEDV